ncbi:MAG: hypothetical protein AAF804_04195 [Bacteroidota bacterium]
MNSEDKILTRHPQGKSGVNILRRRYEQVRTFILDTLDQEGEMTYQALNDRAVEELQDSFDGKVPWYLVTVKLDLEARGEIERVPKTSPHRVRVVED